MIFVHSFILNFDGEDFMALVFFFFGVTIFVKRLACLVDIWLCSFFQLNLVLKNPMKQ